MPDQTEPMLEFFSTETSTHFWNHRDVMESFEHLAHVLVRNLERSPERTVALRKLLESKDAASRAMRMKDGEED